MTKGKKVQKEKQRSTKHTHKTKDRVTLTPLQTGGECRCSGRVGNLTKRQTTIYKILLKTEVEIKATGINMYTTT